MKTFFTVSQTFQTVTPESAEHGDFHDQGFVYKNEKMSIREILRELRDQGIEHRQSYSTSIDIYGWSSVSDYSSLEEETRCLHISGSKRNITRLNRILDGIK